MTIHANLAATEAVVAGTVTKRARRYATDKIAKLIRLSPTPLLSAHLRVTRTAHRDPTKRVIVEANVDANGRPVRVQVAASNTYVAIDLARDRLQRKLSQLGHHPARHQGRERAHRPGYVQRPPVEREVVRRKMFQPATATAEEAALDLEMMDYDFLLFTDTVSGMDSLVCRAGVGGQQVVPLPRAPRLSLIAALGVLDLTDAPFVFFADAETARGNVLYRRHDGHYGLITSAA